MNDKIMEDVYASLKRRKTFSAVGCCTLTFLGSSVLVGLATLGYMASAIYDCCTKEAAPKENVSQSVKPVPVMRQTPAMNVVGQDKVTVREN